jgi:hypothetical protein
MQAVWVGWMLIGSSGRTRVLRTGRPPACRGRSDNGNAPTVPAGSPLPAVGRVRSVRSVGVAGEALGIGSNTGRGAGLRPGGGCRSRRQ